LSPDSGAPEGETPEAGSPRAANLQRHTAGRIEVEVPAGATGALVLTEGYAPGWRATLRLKDGRTRSAAVLRANAAFQAVMVDPEVTSVEWRYVPASFRGGLYLCLAVISALIGATGVLRLGGPKAGAGKSSAEVGRHR
jgi:hypothetical protein